MQSLLRWVLVVLQTWVCPTHNPSRKMEISTMLIVVLHCCPWQAILLDEALASQLLISHTHCQLLPLLPALWLHNMIMAFCKAHQPTHLHMVKELHSPQKILGLMALSEVQDTPITLSVEWNCIEIILPSVGINKTSELIQLLPRSLCNLQGKSRCMQRSVHRFTPYPISKVD